MNEAHRVLAEFSEWSENGSFGEFAHDGKKVGEVDHPEYGDLDVIEFSDGSELYVNQGTAILKLS